MEGRLVSRDGRRTSKLNQLYLLVLALPLVVAGCFEYDQQLVINEDGSGTVDVYYRIPPLEAREEGPGIFPEDIYIPEPPFSERAIIDSFGGVPLVVKDVRVSTSYGDRDASYRVIFENVEDLNGRGIFDLEGGKFAQAFSLVEEGDGVWKYEHVIDFDWPMENYPDHEYYTADCDLNFRVTVPGNIMESNGKVEPGRTVEWSYSLVELLKEETTLSVTYRTAEAVPAEGETEGGRKSMPWVLGALLLCILVGAGISLTLVKRNWLSFMDGVVKTLEKKPVYKTATGVSLVALALIVVVIGVVAYLHFWSQATNMSGVCRYGGYLYAVILAVITYLATHLTVLRAKFILGLPESDFMAATIVSKLIRLAGELAACALAALAIIRGGVAFLLLTTPEAAAALPKYNASTCTLVAGVSAVLAFVSLLFSYLAAELVETLGKVAAKAKSSRGGDR